ncbi:hypothetical protein FHS79_002292 [Polymorphobacter multimanifer]|uniref:DUF2155 domain-containing protein n=1 Tax=Polymorphobacter multimanifer TaxID=1070431 RepID=A0A841L676_9SPHN|nr:hypothetical protein [Polymorphobacter multimanifer]
MRPSNKRLALAGLALMLAAPAVAQAQAPARARNALPEGVTPNAERDVEVAAIDKRSGEMRVFRGKPGQRFSFGTLTVAVRTCETTPPWEPKLTGGFLQIDERRRNGVARIYSGWMFAESPSLNPLEHPRYDIWIRACAMKWPDKGPDTVVVGASTPAAPSSAPKSAETGSAAPSAER